MRRAKSRSALTRTLASRWPAKCRATSKASKSNKCPAVSMPWRQMQPKALKHAPCRGKAKASSFGSLWPLNRSERNHSIIATWPWNSVISRAWLWENQAKWPSSSTRSSPSWALNFLAMASPSTSQKRRTCSRLGPLWRSTSTSQPLAARAFMSFCRMLCPVLRGMETFGLPTDIHSLSAASKSSLRAFCFRKPACSCSSSSVPVFSLGGENSTRKFSMPRGFQPPDLRSSTSSGACIVPLPGPVDQLASGSSMARSQTRKMLATALGQCFSSARAPSCNTWASSGCAAMA
mmetsp:Transcript_84399/g.202296  ORF Transcript_84399/g.202296 Transcript_84399/m.202296 type:complete len:291 (+) Transcript_84399:216-1088(+)